MSHDSPQLTLDDILHIMSPSPVPYSTFDDTDLPTRTNTSTPDPLLESDIVQIRQKITEMRHIDKLDAQLTPREKELAEMVLRLTAVIRPDSDQLLRQADTISALVQQRDLLLHQAEEQRLRWNSEKDGWARMAEALLAQQAKNRLDSDKDEDIERLQATETDNKGLRQRLNETQSRLQMLESELTRLRPSLLMQPLISHSSIRPPTPNSKTQYARRRKKDTTITEDEDHGVSEDEPSVDPFDTPRTSHSQVTPRVKSRKSDAPNSVHPITNAHKRRPQKATSRGLSADARVEHLLLAARKIGKHRAGIMSGMMQHLEERERERRREESAMTAVASTPKTPRRNKAHGSYPSERGYVYMNGQMRPGLGMQPVPLFIPAYTHHLLQTPSSSTTAPSATSSARKAKQDARTNNPPTPLDSLLNAARSMMCEDDVDADENEEVDVLGDSPGNTVGHRPQPRGALGSPVPKRRKVLSRTDKPSTSRGSMDRALMSTSTSNASDMANLGPGRIRSGLDVLADQAAVFGTQEQSVASSQTTETQSRAKGKEKAETLTQEPSESAIDPRGRVKSGRKELEMDTPPTRSQTPWSDIESNMTSHGPDAASISVSEAQVDPGGRTNVTDPSDPSLFQALDSTWVSGGGCVATTNDTPSPKLPHTPSSCTDNPGDVTPRQGACVRGSPGEDDTCGAITQSSPAPLVALSMSENAVRETPPLPRRSEIPSEGEIRESSVSGPSMSSAMAKNKGLARVAEQDAPAPTAPVKRPRSPYVKWSKEEDDLLAQAVAKYGQKWDLVQKALPSRGYHQVRQRWLRKLGVFDSKPDLSSFQTAATTFPSTSRVSGAELRGNPKLGLAPLSSERPFSGLARKSPSMPPS